MPISTFTTPNIDPRYSFPNKYGIPSDIFAAITRQTQYGSILKIIDDADYTVAEGDTHILYKRITAARTLTLPDAASSLNRKLTLIHGGGGAFLINLSSSIRQNFSTTANSLGTSVEYVDIISDGTEWWIVLHN